MSYHFYDMGFKDGYKKALNESRNRNINELFGRSKKDKRWNSTWQRDRVFTTQDPNADPRDVDQVWNRGAKEEYINMSYDIDHGRDGEEDTITIYIAREQQEGRGKFGTFLKNPLTINTLSRMFFKAGDAIKDLSKEASPNASVEITLFSLIPADASRSDINKVIRQVEKIAKRFANEHDLSGDVGIEVDKNQKLSHIKRSMSHIGNKRDLAAMNKLPDWHTVVLRFEPKSLFKP